MSGTEPEVKYDLKENYLVFDANGQFFGIPHARVVSVIDTPKATAMPGQSTYMRGVIDFMGKPVPLFDFRKDLGVGSMREDIDDLVANLMQRKQDHLNWVAKLKECVRSGTEITVQTDPHKCAFGKWYDSFISESLSVSKFMRQFDAPHKRIHAIAVTAKEYLDRNDQEGALALIDEVESKELRSLVALFDEAEEFFHRSLNEYTIVVQDGSNTLSALVVDKPKYFGPFKEIVYPLPNLLFAGRTAGFVDAYGICESEEEKDEILIIDVERYLAGEGHKGTMMEH